ncbi:MAG: C-terminal helicase domain-containing protein, partial [Planctomycetota bacterium]
SVKTIAQRYFTVEQNQKGELLRRLLKREQPRQAIVFCRTKRGVDRLQRSLSMDFDSCQCMHGDMQQRDRDRVLQNLREGNLNILVATDVVGRGIDVSTVSHIINYDVPQDCDDYVHRVGRTGRMGREGIAYTFIVPGEGDFLTSIERRINQLLKPADMEGFDPTPTKTRAAKEKQEAAEEAERNSQPGKRRLTNTRKITRRR